MELKFLRYLYEKRCEKKEELAFYDEEDEINPNTSEGEELLSRIYNSIKINEDDIDFRSFVIGISKTLREGHLELLKGKKK
jgi:SpoVK/Ycf46/Vps4 family AAA+-type ATPase